MSRCQPALRSPRLSVHASLLAAIALTLVACGDAAEPGLSQPTVPTAPLLGADGVEPADVREDVETPDASGADGEDGTDTVPADTEPEDIAPDAEADAAEVTEPDVGPDVAEDVAEDAGPADVGPDSSDAGPLAECGNGLVEGDEACDDANDDETDGCLNDCKLARCGDGRLRVGVETCDTAIAEGQDGACPSTCTSNDACIPRVLAGEGCTLECVESPIGSCGPSDGCCPENCDAVQDGDCEPDCGNGVIEAGETCDGNCPSTCASSGACSFGVLEGTPGACNVVCRQQPITACGPADGCCATGCNSNDDGDCSPTCGNGFVESGETCDPPGSCPSSCPGTGDRCLAWSLEGSAGNCNAECVSTEITACGGEADGCCPEGCNATNDRDCNQQCGNGVREGTEACDGDDVSPGFRCNPDCTASPLPTVFRFTDLDLRDPHIHLGILWFPCNDLTDNPAPFNVSPSINAQIQSAITTDTDNPQDGELNLSLLGIFDPLRTDSRAPLPFGFSDASCTAPMSTTTCRLDGATPTWTTYTVNTVGSATNDVTACLGPLPQTTGDYDPPVASATAANGQPCWASSEIEVAIDVAGTLVPLSSAQIGGRFTGQPPSGISNGLIRGFISEEEAEAIVIDIPFIGQKSLASLLPGGDGSCAPHDDRDTAPNGNEMGWWFYMNYTAAKVPLED